MLGSEVIMDKREFTVVVEQGEDGYLVGYVPELQGCHSQGRTLDELLDRMREAIELCLEDEDELAPASRLIGVHRVAV